MLISLRKNNAPSASDRKYERLSVTRVTFAKRADGTALKTRKILLITDTCSTCNTTITDHKPYETQNVARVSLTLTVCPSMMRTMLYRSGERDGFQRR